MAKKHRRRRRVGHNKKTSQPARASDIALRQSALRAVRRALVRAEETVRAIDAALRGKLKTKRRKRNATRPGGARAR